MSRLPFVSDNIEKQRRIIAEFKGVNVTPARGEGEFFDMLNMSNDMFPNLCVRQGRKRYEEGAGSHSLGAKDKLYYVKNNNFHYDDEARFVVGDTKKQYAHIGSLIIIFPDKVYYDVEKNENGSLAAEYLAEGSVTFGTDSMTFSSVTADSGFYDFSVGDAIVISGCKDLEENNISAIISEIDGKKITFTTDNIFKEGQENGKVTIKREIPDMDYICEFGNRLWGCKGNEIYASAFGDPFNFNKFNGTKAASYTITLGTDGDFTGMVSFMSHLIFFKEECIHKLYGDNPNNYEIVTTTCQGVENGACKTIKIVGETVYYKGIKGVYAYTGGMPLLISNVLGSDSFKGICAGTDLTKYYITAEKGDKSYIYVYNPQYNTWCVEDNELDIRGFVNVGGNLYAEGAFAIYIFGDGDPKWINWSFSMMFNETVLEKKGYGKLQIRYNNESPNGFICVGIQNDDEPMREIRLMNSNKKTIVIPIPIRRSDKMILRFSGKGAFTLETLVREFYSGSDR